jgi:HSP20 family protein
MTLTRWNARPRNHFPNWVDEFFNPAIWDQKATHQPNVNVLENDKAFTLEISSPGMDKGDFSLEIEDGSLVVKAERKQEREEKEGKVLRREFDYQSFERKFLLPDDVNVEDISAQYEKGILSVVLPKSEPEMPKKKVIQIG